MKQIYTILFFVLSFTTVEAKNIITFNTWLGAWSDVDNWSPRRLPKNGDSIVIPAFNTVILDQATSLTNVGIKIAGSMIVAQKLALSHNSLIDLEGSITRLGWFSSLEVVTIGNVNKIDSKVTNIIYGPGIASSASGVSPNGFLTAGTLPVTFTSFYANRKNSNVELSWTTAAELNNKEFEIQRSVDGTNWTVIATVNGAGTTTSTQKYSYTDRNVNAPTAFYRIRQVDIGGAYTYSIVKTVRNDKSEGPAAKIYASNKTVNVEFNKAIDNAISIRVFSMNGTLVSQQKVAQSSYRIQANLSHVQPGIYVVQVSDGAGINQVTKVVL